MSVSEYIKETQGELKRVSWPTRKQVIASTIAIVVVSVAMSLLLGVYDFAFSSVLGKLVVNTDTGSGLTAPLSTTTPESKPTTTEETMPIQGSSPHFPTGPIDTNNLVPTVPFTTTPTGN